MKRSLTLLLLTPLLLTSCSNSSVSFKALKARVDTIADTHEHPFYKVVGSLDFNGMITEISEQDGTFDQNPNGSTYVANARYYEGFYNPYTTDSQVLNEEDVVIYGMASRSYWLRMPLRITKDNFYVEMDFDGEIEENPTCAHYQLVHTVCAWIDSSGAVNASTNKPYYELLPNGGFAIGGRNVHSRVTIDNFPYYLDYARHPELGEWDELEPLPCYKSYVDGRFDMRFEYNKDGWLVKETLQTSDYDYRKNTDGQVALRAVYNYKFS